MSARAPEARERAAYASGSFPGAVPDSPAKRSARSDSPELLALGPSEGYHVLIEGCWGCLKLPLADATAQFNQHFASASSEECYYVGQEKEMATASSEYGSKRDHQTILLLCAVVLTGLTGFLFLAVRLRWYTMDGSYISFRYASNLVAGHGLVFNPGETPRADGIVSPLYAFLLAPAGLLGVRMVVLSKLMGLAACLCSSLLVGLTVYQLARSLTKLPPAGAALISAGGAAWLLCNPYVVGNALSGMETGVSGLAVSLFLFLLVKYVSAADEAVRPRATCAAIAAVLVPMFRPEMALFTLVVLLAGMALCPHSRRLFLAALGIFLGLGVGYWLVRSWYYGLPFPLPFYIKQGGPQLSGLTHVVSYLKHVYPLAIGICVAVSFALGPLRAACGPLPGLITVFPLAVAVELGYYSSLHHITGFGLRYFMPVTPALVIASFAGIAVFYDLSIRSKVSQVYSCQFFLGVLFAFLLGKNALAYGAVHGRFVEWYATNQYRNKKIARTMASVSEGAPLVIAMNDCGAIPFYTGFPTIDLAGLNNRRIAREPSSEAACAEIHEKRPHLVILVAGKPHTPGSVYGWERLTHFQLHALGYHYEGAMEVGTMPSGQGYWHLIYARQDAASATQPFLDRLAQAGVLELL
jgi:arabinofuranosyltransferase